MNTSTRMWLRKKENGDIILLYRGAQRIGRAECEALTANKRRSTISTMGRVESAEEIT
jgi:hypothetical protein